MKLNKVTISKFRSLKKEETLLLDDKITILIGANDHGKTNILSAIEFLNDDKIFSLEDVNWDTEVDPNAEITWYFTPSAEVSEKLAKMQYVPVTETGAEGLTTVKPAPASFPVNKDNQIIFFRSNKENKVKVKSLPLSVEISKEALVLALRPRVELFIPPTTNLRDQVTLAELTTPEFEFMQGIFRLAGIWENRAEIFSQTDKTSKLLTEASERLTSVLNSKWNQGRDLKWKLEHTGTNGNTIVIMIQDPAINARYTRPSLRSSGFRTYFLLSMITLARTESKHADSYLYLFDEPGTYLHPHAQLDLQRSLETIASRTQIIYTTHSLFLISKNYPGRNRVISKGTEGTKIDQKPFLKNWKSVRESLGILLSNNFLIAEKTLLVEGPSDVIYILHAIKKLKEESRIDIDLNDISLVDAGSADNYLAMAKLMLAEGREVVALLDSDSSGDIVEKQLKKVCENEIKGKKLTIHKLPKDNSIEDIFTDLSTLKSAITGVSNDLVTAEIRTFVNGFNPATEIEKIKLTTGTTLGRIIDTETAKWFNPEGKISKLSIALKYEDIMPTTITLSEKAETEIKKIKDILDLKSERNGEQSIFSE